MAELWTQVLQPREPDNVIKSEKRHDAEQGRQHSIDPIVTREIEQPDRVPRMFAGERAPA